MTTAEMAHLLLSRDGFLILTHCRPDGDTAGSAAALCRGLRMLGKTAYLYKNPEFGRRLLTYTDGLHAPEGFTPQTVAAVDIASRSLFPEGAEAYCSDIFICIDHHPSNEGYAAHTLLDADAAACGELIYLLLRELGLTLDTALADALYVAVANDTGCFRYANTTARTHQIAAELMLAGCDSNGINKLFFGTRSKARFDLERRVMESIEFYAGGRVALVRLGLSMLEETHAGEEELDNISAIPRELEGVSVAVTVRELPDKRGFKLSVRSDGCINASELCRSFGGGGHAGAAGCSFDAGDAEARIAEFIEALERSVMVP